MQVLKKIVDGGEIVGYLIDDGSFTLPMCKKALFLEMYINPLLEVGYKYYGYDANLIEDPNGRPISELEVMDKSEVDDLEWYASVELANTDALSDADASKYYTFREESAYQFKTEPSYQINTREEFLAYLNQIKNTFYNVNYVSDNRPINYFVNPDALFTIDELSSNPELRSYFDIIIKRHCIRDYATYRKLIGWLQEQGVLNTDNPTMAEFLTAYYAWGPEGLKDKCTKVETKLNVDGMFQYMRDPLSSDSPSGYAISNRDNKISVVDAREGVHFLKTHENFSNITEMSEFKRSRIAFPSDNMLFTIRRASNTGKKYMPVSNTMYSDVSDRLYITLISESGFIYCYKVAHNKIKIGLAHSDTSAAIYYATNNFSLASVFAGVNIPLDIVNNYTDYYLWNLAIIKSVKVSQARSRKAPVRSTSEYLLNDGVNPIAVVDKIAYSVTNNSKAFKTNSRYELSNKDDTFYDALELYLQPIPDYILEVYDLKVEDLDNGIESFLELADVDELSDRREQMMDDKLEPGMPGFDYTYKAYQNRNGKRKAAFSEAAALLGRDSVMYDAVDYYTKLLFVHDCLYGNIAVDNFGDGMFDDLNANYYLAAECMLTAVYAEYGNDVDRTTATNAIVNMENEDLIDINSIFRMRDAAYTGYLIDFAKYRKTRGCENTWLWAYCTKVFREISNAPVEKQRPYLMELVVIRNDNTDTPLRNLMTEVVKYAIEKSDLSETIFYDYNGNEEWSEKKCAMESAEYIGAKLFFYVYAGGIKTEPIDNIYHVTMNMYDGVDLKIEIPVEIYNVIKAFNVEAHKMYMTVYDYCKYEFRPNTSAGTFVTCVVNADIDPWHVKPKKGYTIASYPLLPNYYEADALNKVNGENFYPAALEKKAICVKPLKNAYKTKFITPDFSADELIMYEDEVRTSSDVNPLYDYLNADMFEFIFAYTKRWSLERKAARELGKTLISIPLKQDIVYSSLASIYCDEVPATESIYSDSALVDDKACQSDTTIKKISWRDFFDTNVAIDMRQVTIKEFTISDIDVYEAQQIEDILSSEYVNNIPITITGNYINVKGDTVMRIVVSRLTPAQISEFVEAGILRKLSENKYFIKAINGDFILNVM
jgi:hypothetical protein